MRSAYGEGPPPWELQEYHLCQEFTCLPSQLEREDAPTLMRCREASWLNEAFRKLKEGKPLTDAEYVATGEVLQIELDMTQEKASAE